LTFLLKFIGLIEIGLYHIQTAQCKERHNSQKCHKYW